ncbi:MAG: RsmD family RNA methyltransferase [Bacteroides sp.]|nr:RsmD family RNA methyltransferase [Bacteroides sp.]MCM1086206.1 RsmD family RNA methyltransferase [Bacteroides sp.]
MRIISGEFKGRRFQAPDTLPVRPTTDAAKESLFNILGNHLEWDELDVLDLFAGIGSISLEFVSRGVRQVHAVDSYAGCVKFIQSMAQKFQMDNLYVFRQDAFDYLKRSRFSYNLIFADPPYQMENIAEIPNIILNSDCLVNDGFFILEHSAHYNFEADPRCIEERRYGKVHFSFFRKVEL